ncbi:ETEC_3214 domain-containing protein [Alkalimarinus alittae]|uniref:Uncharacterized protein n=1 Tax=Alkalimarinus alittae TaxID=2961619 RepID=A0ABY6MZP1_9ALTE|nr:ETEC_3214 domain-containing protein [Alkalimarinus alittae]UZE95308.1 hypothetical protein NKI27_14730 [Alkalimarinus alittae]
MSESPTKPAKYDKTKTILLGFLALVIALGEYTEAVSLINEARENILILFTNDLEYETLGKIHVGNTVAYVEGLVGSPQVSRAIDEDTVANYFYHEKYFLTLFYREDRIAAYVVVPLIEGFQLPVLETDSETFELSEFTYSDYPANPTHYVIDHSKTSSYYMEILDSGRSGLFVNTYIGTTTYGTGDHPKAIADLYEKEVHGSDEEITTLQASLRSNTRPNLFGQGSISLELIEKSLLTAAEFKSYFGTL